jgi:hypothetical protein
MLNETELKEKLEACARNEFRPPEQEQLSDFLPAMLTHIGSTDSALRDDLIYSAWNAWILDYHALRPEQLHNLLSSILDEQHLFHRLGEQDTDSVFTRSFSMLVLPLLLITHRSQPLFSPTEIRHIKERLLYYLEHESDRRGFVRGKGWAHAIAHAADALDDLAQCAEMDQPDLAEILEAIRSVICVESTCYTHLEEERLATAVLAVLGRGILSEGEIVQWLAGFADSVTRVPSEPEKHTIRANVKNFLQSLYFRLQWEPLANKFETPIQAALRSINPFARQDHPS